MEKLVGWWSTEDEAPRIISVADVGYADEVVAEKGLLSEVAERGVCWTTPIPKLAFLAFPRLVVSRLGG